MSKILGACLVVLMFASAAFAQQSVVEAAKAQAVAAGEIPQGGGGACGAFAITKRVAWALRDRGFKFLVKRGGNRAIILSDGRCVSDQESNAPGYATDYLIQLPLGYGYDILSDGGGQNGPQWPDPPETDGEMVRRNLGNFADPFNPGGEPLPGNPPSTGNPGAPVDPVDAALTKTVLALVDALQAVKDQLVAVQARLDALQGQADHIGVETSNAVSLGNKLADYLKARPIPDGCKVSYLGCRMTFNGAKLE